MDKHHVCFIIFFTAGADYIAITNQTVRFRANEADYRDDEPPLIVNITNDELIENGTEYFDLIVTVKKNGFLDGEESIVIRVTIIDDDSCELSLYTCNHTQINILICIRAYTYVVKALQINTPILVRA